MVIYCVILNLSEKDIWTIMAFDVDITLLDDLRELFTSDNETRIYQIMSEICLIKEKQKTAPEYHLKLSGRTRELSQSFIL